MLMLPILFVHAIPVKSTQHTKFIFLLQFLLPPHYSPKSTLTSWSCLKLKDINILLQHVMIFLDQLKEENSRKPQHKQSLSSFSKNLFAVMEALLKSLQTMAQKSKVLLQNSSNIMEFPKSEFHYTKIGRAHV